MKKQWSIDTSMQPSTRTASDFITLRSGFTQPGYAPYQDYHRLRAHAPVWRAPWGDWYLSSSRAVTDAFAHPACSSRRGLSEMAMPHDVARFFADWLLFLDPPEHVRLRHALMGMFTPSRIATLEPSIARIAETLIPGEEGSLDFVTAFAKLLPVMIIADLVGMPRTDQDRIPAWAEVIRGAFDDLPEPQSQLPHAVLDMRSYFLDLVTDPTWRRGSDFRRILQSTPKEALAAHMAFLVFAGHETTVHLLASMMQLLAVRPADWRRLQDAPALARSAVEETLRFESPVQKIMRRTAESVTIEGITIPGNQSLVLLLGAANRDPARFTRPDEFIIDRTPQGQIAFGLGGHLCLGRSLALLEATVALQVLLRQWAEVSIGDGGWSWHVNASFRGLERLDLRWREARPA